MTSQVVAAVLGVCCSCQSAHPVYRRIDLSDEEREGLCGPNGYDDAVYFVMSAHMISGDSGDSCDGQGTTPQTILSDDDIAGKAQCGCVYHAEDGIPCKHDIALAMKR